MVFIIILNTLAAVLLSVSAVFYLSTKYNKKSTFYFFGALLILMSDIFAALEKYYMADFTLNLFDRILHLLGFYFVYRFCIESKEPTKIVEP